jgi:hypothetical protein
MVVARCRCRFNLSMCNYDTLRSGGSHDETGRRLRVRILAYAYAHNDSTVENSHVAATGRSIV